MLKYYIQLAFERRTFIRAIRVAILIGIILNLINNSSTLFVYSLSSANLGRIFLTFLVPYLVSTYSSVISGSQLKIGSISRLDALLKCKNCKKTNFLVHIGQVFDECPQCKKNTRWSLVNLYSKLSSNSDLLKSLALFARYNPQPLFRIDSFGIILGSNPASEQLFSVENLNGIKLEQFIPEVAKIDLLQLIRDEGVREILISHSAKFYNLVFRGVPVLNSVHVYGNNITEIVKAERKIKQQADEIQESINYAWRIQKAMLPDEDMMTGLFPEHFIFYRPRNTVSGDFYWVNQIGHHKIVAVADCTGHGVPGAFMSMMGISLLNEIILREKNVSPSIILNTLRERLILSLKTGSKKANIADGMDISLAVIDENLEIITFSGAYNSLYIVRDSELIILEADRMPVGEYINDTVSFTEKIFSTQTGDRLVLYTDGYKDQYGGEKNKKLTSRLFKELLIESSALLCNEQFLSIENKFDNWKNEHEQIDDVLVMGIAL